MTTILGRLRNVLLVAGFPFFFLSNGPVACGSTDATGLEAPDQTLLTVVMSTRAVTLATAAGYNTIQLSAVAYRGTGEVIPDVVPTYVVSDNTLHVTPEGLVTGLKVTTRSKVIGRVTYNGVTRTDTTWITVINTMTPSPLQDFRISMPDTLNAGITEPIGMIVVDMDGASHDAGTPVTFRVSDNLVATANEAGQLKTILPERSVTLYATTLYYGVTYTDSAVIRIGYPNSVVVSARPRMTSTGETVLEFSPNTAYVAKGGFVLFCNCLAGIANTKLLDVVFDSPDDMGPGTDGFYPTGTGNIPPFMKTTENPLGTFQTRTIAKPGTYTYRSELNGTSGKLIVR